MIVFYFQNFFKIFLLIFELIIVPHFILNIFPDVLAVWTDTGHQNSRMYGIATVRVLQAQMYDLEINEGTKENFSLRSDGSLTFQGPLRV